MKGLFGSYLFVCKTIRKTKQKTQMLSKLQLNKKVALHLHLVKGLFGLLLFGWCTFGPHNKQNKTSKMLNKKT